MSKKKKHLLTIQLLLLGSLFYCAPCQSMEHIKQCFSWIKELFIPRMRLSSIEVEEAVVNGDIEELKKALASGFGINEELSPYDDSMLFLAAANAQPTLARWLIEHGARVNTADPVQLSVASNAFPEPLLQSLAVGRDSGTDTQLNSLLDQANSWDSDAAQKAQDVLERAFLIGAAQGNITFIRLLLAAKTLPPPTLYEGLIRAALAGHLDVFTLLYPHVDTQNCTGVETLSRALAWASAQGHVALVSFILDQEFSTNAGLAVQTTAKHIQEILANPYLGSSEDALQEVHSLLLRFLNALAGRRAFSLLAQRREPNLHGLMPELATYIGTFLADSHHT